MKLPKSLKFVRKKGFSLVEVIVAIGVSIVTLTGSVVFSVQLYRRSQENFFEVSALQLQSLLVEELRLLESGLKTDVRNNLGNSSAYTAPNTFLGNQWQPFCTNNSLNYFKLTFPDLSTSQSSAVKINITDISTSGTAISVPDEGGNQYRFANPFQGTSIQQFGSFNVTGANGTAIMASMNKSVVQGNANPLNNVITIKTIITYNLFNKTYFTKSQETKMVYSLVCPS